ncbi:hypothetical protein [Bradyrhizobium sp. BR 10289]|uniref:hypothetical protein n=1 Tax=Bradyrhizobium sp. BR 10289 TaxID=2749993 RepID=UPI001C651E6A|nr:hypothetical protein [Bradyrhizobium sp. BR 10289]MBW7972428.1 hypothetical protein [Bradyrhizobium sp. BR 10289]
MQYHARMDLPGKHVRAVKRMPESGHCRESRALMAFRGAIPPFTLARICSVALCRRGTAAMQAGLFQHISGI